MAQGWVMVAEGEGATAKVLQGELHQAVHDFMCFCGQPWRECKDEYIKNDVAMVDDPDSWSTDEDGDKFSVQWKHETGRISLFALHE